MNRQLALVLEGASCSEGKKGFSLQLLHPHRHAQRCVVQMFPDPVSGPSRWTTTDLDSLKRELVSLIVLLANEGTAT